MRIESVGFIGWRGMVGSVLLERMRAEGDFEGLSPVFYSTSQVGEAAPMVGVAAPPLADAYDTTPLAGHEAIVSCQGGDYTKQILPKLRASGWQGYWIDAASAIRMDEDTVLALDPLNARALVFESGGRRLGVVALDVTIITEEYSAAIRSRVADTCDIEPNALMVHATQTHSAPTVGDLMVDPRDKSRKLAVIPLMLRRDYHYFLLPDNDEPLQPGDRLLFCGKSDAYQQMDWILSNGNMLDYVLGKPLQGGWVARKLGGWMAQRAERKAVTATPPD